MKHCFLTDRRKFVPGGKCFNIVCWILLFLTNHSFAQTTIPQGPGIQWQKALGGTLADMVLTISQTSDDGFIVGGVTASKDGDVSSQKGKGDLFVVKYDKNGNSSTASRKTFGGSGEEQGCIVLQTADGGYIVGGNTASNSGDVRGFHGGEKDIWVLRLKPDLTIAWQRALGGSKTDEIVSIKLTPDGGFLITGNTNSVDGDVKGHHGDFDIWVIKLTESASKNSSAIQWQRCYGSSGTEKIKDLQTAQNGTYLFAGYTENAGSGGDVTNYHDSIDVWIGRIDATGALLWQTSLGGSKNESYFSNFINPTDDGGFVVAASTRSTDGDVAGLSANYGTWIVKFDALYAIQWQHIIQDGNTVNTFIKTKDNGFMVSTIVPYSNLGTNEGTLLVKLSATGALLWQKEIGGSGGDRPVLMEATDDGGCLVTGTTDSKDIYGYLKESNESKVGTDAWIIKLDGTGNILWQRAYGGTGTEEYQVGTYTFGTYFPINTSMIAPWCTYNKFIKSRDGGYFFALETTSSNGDVSGFHYSSKSGVKFDIWVVKLDPDNITATSSLLVKKEAMVNEITINKELLAYPNPFVSATTIRFTAAESGAATVELLDVNGTTLQTLFSSQVTKGQTCFVPISNISLPKAVYIYRIKINNYWASGKLIKK